MVNVDTVLLTFDLPEGRASLSLLVDGTYAVLVGGQLFNGLRWQRGSIREAIETVISLLGRGKTGC